MAKDCILEHLLRDAGEQTVLQSQVGREGERGKEREREGGRKKRGKALRKTRGVRADGLYPPRRNSTVPLV